MKKNYGKMIAVIFTLMILIGCSEILPPVDMQDSSFQEETGTVLIRLNDNAERTLLPTPPSGFSRYSISFNGTSGQQPVNEIYDISAGELTGSGKSVTLAQGNWTATLTAHTDIRGVAGLSGGEYPAARGSAVFTVAANESNTPVIITINPITNEGAGILRYKMESAGRLRVLNVNGTELNPIVSMDLTAGASGNRELASGYYILQAESGSRVTASVFHIYSGMTTNAILNNEFRFVQQVVPAGDTNLVLRYEVNQAGNAFQATPVSGSAWNATLHGSAFFTTMNGLGVVDMGNNNGYINLGASAGATLQTLPEFSIETYVYIPFQNLLRDNDTDTEGHFLWTFSNSNTITATSGRFMAVKAANRRFSVSNAGTNSQTPAYSRFNNSNNPLRRGIFEHVVLTRTGNTFRLYVDGKLENTVTSTVAYNGFGNMDFNYLSRPLIGNNPTAHLNGAKFYRLSVYNKAFSLDEINNDLGAREIIEGFPRERILPKDSSVPMKHVGLHNQEDFDRIKSMLAANREPWVTGHQKLLTNSHAQTSWNPAFEVDIRRSGNQSGNNFMNAARSGAAAYANAVIYRIGHVANPRTFADKAILILNGWADINKSLSGDSDVSLAAGLYGYMFALAGELMRGYDGWAPADFTKYQQWLLDVFYASNTGNMDFLIRHHNNWDDHYWTNWDMCNIASLMAIGIVCDRRDIYNWALEALQGNYGEPHRAYGANQRRVVGNGYWFKAINYVHVTEDGEELAQQQESGRDQGHTVMNIGSMGVIAQLAWNQGDDLFGLGDNLFLKMCEYVSKYNIAGLDVPFTRYVRLWQGNNNPSRDTMTRIASHDQGQNRPVWGLPYYHYTVVKGIDPGKARWTKLATEVEFTLQDWGPQMGNPSGAYDQPGYTLLMYAR